MRRSRQQVLEDLAVQYETELARAWVDGMTIHRLRALRESLDSARTELRAIVRAQRKETDHGGEGR